jgi:transcriptional regulator with XRE-family HTH domain
VRPTLGSREANALNRESSKAGNDFRHFGAHVRKARTRHRLTQKGLAALCGLTQSDVSKIESGERWPTPPQLARLARELGVALQWFLTGHNQPDLELAAVALQLRELGLVDLWVPDAQVPGAFAPPEQVVARAVRGDAPDPRLVEGFPAVFAWNSWNEHLLTAYARTTDPRATARLAWLADLALTIHRGQRFPGGLVDPLPLLRFVKRTKPRPQPDDLGRPALNDDELPPVSRRWNIRYAADVDTFARRAAHLLSLRTDAADHSPVAHTRGPSDA